MDVLDLVYQALIADEYINEKVFNRIKFYEYPETGDVTGPHIIMELVDSPNPSNFADNKWLTYNCYLQIEVWSPNRKITNQIADKVRDVLWDSFGFVQKRGPQEYDEGVFRDARRYEGTIYRDDLDGV